MYLKSLYVNHFRCFDQSQFTFEKPVTLIEGVNGSGKTSLLEAIHYLCYLRSFRTHSPHDLMQRQQETFFIKGVLADEHDPLAHRELQVGFAGKKRVVKVDQKPITSHKELIAWYRVVTLTEDDLGLIREGPELRRSFIDQATLLHKPAYGALLKKLKHVVESRNAILKQPRVDEEAYHFWTQELDTVSALVVTERKEVLQQLESELHQLIKTYFAGDFSLTLQYQAKREYGITASDQDMFKLMSDEMRYGRSLMGAHVDDIDIVFQHEKTKVFASRGQQKLIVLLLKAAQVGRLVADGMVTLFLLDDFMTDFDDSRMALALRVLSDLKCQLILTVPFRHQGLIEHLKAYNAHIVVL